MQKIDGQKRNFEQRIRCWVFLRHCLAWFRTLGYFFTALLWNPWQVLMEPLGSAEPWLKITGIWFWYLTKPPWLKQLGHLSVGTHNMYWHWLQSLLGKEQHILHNSW